MTDLNQKRSSILWYTLLLPLFGDEEVTPDRTVLVHPGQIAFGRSHWTEQYPLSISVHKVLKRMDGKLIKTHIRYSWVLCLDHKTMNKTGVRGTTS